jgi:hypothetical protein
VITSRTAIVGQATDGTSLTMLELEGWRAWARDHLEASLGGPARIGEYVMPPEAFDGFGVASLAPDGRRVFLTTTTYAMATTLSVVSVLELGPERYGAMAEPAFGDVEEVVWSPAVQHVAYSLGTARASGDALRVDDVAAFVAVHELDGAALIDASGGLLAALDHRDWLPEIRQLAWLSPDVLSFVTHGATDADDPIRWRLAIETGDLRID